jgi:hypothetical protein
MCLPFLLTAKPPKPEQCDWPARVLSEFNTFALSQEMPQRLTQSMYIQPQTLKLPSTAIFASAYALSTAESVPRSGDVLRRTEDTYGLESIDCCCATLKSGALFMASG